VGQDAICTGCTRCDLLRRTYLAVCTPLMDAECDVPIGIEVGSATIAWPDAPALASPIPFARDSVAALLLLAALVALTVGAGARLMGKRDITAAWRAGPSGGAGEGQEGLAAGAGAGAGAGVATSRGCLVGVVASARAFAPLLVLLAAGTLELVVCNALVRAQSPRFFMADVGDFSVRLLAAQNLASDAATSGAAMAGLLGARTALALIVCAFTGGVSALPRLMGESLRGGAGGPPVPRSALLPFAVLLLVSVVLHPTVIWLAPAAAVEAGAAFHGRGIGAGSPQADPAEGPQSMRRRAVMVRAGPAAVSVVSAASAAATTTLPALRARIAAPGIVFDAVLFLVAILCASRQTLTADLASLLGAMCSVVAAAAALSFHWLQATGGEKSSTGRSAAASAKEEDGLEELESREVRSSAARAPESAAEAAAASTLRNSTKGATMPTSGTGLAGGRGGALSASPASSTLTSLLPRWVIPKGAGRRMATGGGRAGIAAGGPTTDRGNSSEPLAAAPWADRGGPIAVANPFQQVLGRGGGGAAAAAAAAAADGGPFATRAPYPEPASAFLAAPSPPSRAARVVQGGGAALLRGVAAAADAKTPSSPPPLQLLAVPLSPPSSQPLPPPPGTPLGPAADAAGACVPLPFHLPAAVDVATSTFVHQRSVRAPPLVARPSGDGRPSQGAAAGEDGAAPQQHAATPGENNMSSSASSASQRNPPAPPPGAVPASGRNAEQLQALLSMLAAAGGQHSEGSERSGSGSGSGSGSQQGSFSVRSGSSADEGDGDDDGDDSRASGAPSHTSAPTVLHGAVSSSEVSGVSDALNPA
jgi:hypothetical protein